MLEPLDGDGGTYRFNQRSEIAQRLPGLDRPEWFPPIGLKDLAELHDNILRFCLHHDWDGTASVDTLELYVLVERTWRHRLPLEPDEVGVLLRRHGLPDAALTEVVYLFRHCRQILISAIGRKPIKKKRGDYVRRKPIKRPARDSDSRSEPTAPQERS
ncbi:MAG: hypothetical protein HY682_07235 [Chloroflexi bacterium]|nr:hypothetical protein [Chloroflexota bacterium]